MYTYKGKCYFATVTNIAIIVCTISFDMDLTSSEDHKLEYFISSRLSLCVRSRYIYGYNHFSPKKRHQESLMQMKLKQLHNGERDVSMATFKVLTKFRESRFV
jgi:hypothetical protein